MIIKLFDTILPDHCCFCGDVGSIVCDSCRNDITNSRVNQCLKCGRVIDDSCNSCNLSYQKSWCTGDYEQLGILVKRYKFESNMLGFATIAKIISDSIPEVPTSTIVVPVPTIRRHVNDRGFDHTKLLAKQIAGIKKCKFRQILRRDTETKQVGATKTERLRQAKKAFTCRYDLSSESPYLLIDDVATTGATLQEAAKVLRSKGAKTVWAAVLAYQELAKRSPY